MARRVKCRGHEVREKGGDDSRLGDYFVFEHTVADADGGHETARVDFQVPGVTRTVEGNDDFFIGEVEFAEGDVGTVSPGAGVIRIECYCGRKYGISM